MTGSDVYWAIETLLANPNGTTPATIKTVELETDVIPTRRRATITGITSPGLRSGQNIVTVAVRPYGSTVSTLEQVTLKIPAGMPLKGTVTAASGGDVDSSTPEGASIADRVAGLNAAPANSDIVVHYSVGEPEDPDSEEDSQEPNAEFPPVRGVAHTTHVIEGYGEAVTSETTLEPSATPIVAGQQVTLSGTVEPAANTGTVRVERRTSGSPTWKLLDAALELTVEDDVAQFELTDRPTANSIYRVSYPGSGGTVLGSSAQVGVVVRGRVTVAGSPSKTGFTLAAAVYPKAAGSTITFQRFVAGKWRAIKAVKTLQTGQVRYAWATPKGTYQVRAGLTGTPTLAGNWSATIRLRR